MSTSMFLSSHPNVEFLPIYHSWVWSTSKLPSEQLSRQGSSANVELLLVKTVLIRSLTFTFLTERYSGWIEAQLHYV